MVVEKDRALQLEPCRREAVQRRARDIELMKGCRRVARVEEGAPEAHPRLSGSDCQLRFFRGAHCPPQVANGGLSVLQLERGEAERAFRE